MLKKVTLIFAVVIMTATLSLAQWVNQGSWPANSPQPKGQNHALAVDPDGKVWVGWWGPKAKFGVAPGDTLKKSVYLIFVFKPDGTQASFSPIWRLDGPGFQDTLLTTNRGFRTNVDGNILMVTGSNPTPNYMYLIDYKTGKALKRVQLKWTPAAPAVAKTSKVIFVAPVVGSPTNPIEMYDQNFTLIGNALDKTTSFSRSFEVSEDGNTIYWAGYTLGKVLVYNRADEFSSFTLKDSIMAGARAESFTWHPVKKEQLWISGGSNNDKPNPPFTMGTWYAYDVKQKKVVDSLKWKFADPAKPDERPRALGFSPDGKIAYLGSFGSANSDLVQKVVFGGSAVEKLDEIPVGYELSQNYPNPFNPTTNIKFSLPKEGFVTLRVYNSIGQEVATLVNDFKSAGSYQVDFNASNLSSGVYVYTLSVGNYKISKKMMLMK
ncbi:MAG: T9SS type A sorting domain-containing protein [Stygiobacter sp.]